MASQVTTKKDLKGYLLSFGFIALGAFLAAISIRFFLFPNKLIDGGIIGISMILANIFGKQYVSYYLVLLNLPFIYLAFKHIRANFVLYMGAAVFFFAAFLFVLENYVTFPAPDFDYLEAIVIGGAILGVGFGTIIRNGGCTDGTEILAIIINRKKGFTVGQVVLGINFLIFAAYGIISKDWHIALQSLLMYVVAFKMMDLVIVGLDEMKSVTIISSKPKILQKVIRDELNLGLTILQGKGGVSGESREILMVIVERLDLAELKEIVLDKDPTAFMAIENLHEVVTGRGNSHLTTKKKHKKN